MIRLGIGLAVLSAGMATLFAESVPYEFAIPEFTQTLSLGVYDESGQLVRHLVQQAEINDFEIGLNGLIGKWDGKNDAGQTVAAGTYHLRGFALGDLKTEGIGYHFNDWVAELGDAVPIIHLRAIVANPHGGVCVLAQIAEGRSLLFYYRTGEGILWKRILPESFGQPSKTNLALMTALPLHLEAWRESLLAADENTVAVAQAGDLVFYGILNGQELGEVKLAEPAEAMAFQPDQLIVVQGEKWMAYSPQNLTGTPVENPGIRLNVLAGTRGGLFGADAAGKVWKSDGVKWKEFELAGDPRVFSLAPGDKGALWVVAEVPGTDRLVGEFSTEGEFLKNLQMPDGDLSPMIISTAPPSGEIYVLRRSNSQQQILGIRLAAGAAGGPPVWEIFCDKKIQDSSDFGLADGQLLAEVPKIPDAHFTLKMVDPMTKRPKQVQLDLAIDAAGIRLLSADGLALDSVVTGTDIRRLAIQTGKTTGTLQLFVGRKGFVEEFNLKGLNQIALLDVGEIEWPGK